MQEKLLKKLMSAMEMKKAGNSTLPALMMERASVEAARDIKDFVTPCCDITAPITVGALSLSDSVFMVCCGHNGKRTVKCGSNCNCKKSTRSIT